MATSKVTFSTRPFNVGDMELAHKLSSGDITTAIELAMRRADPPVARSVFEDMMIDEWTATLDALSKSVSTSIFLTNLFGALKDEDGK